MPKILIAILIFLSSISFGHSQNIEVFRFTDEELSNLKVRKVRGAKNMTEYSILVEDGSNIPKARGEGEAMIRDAEGFKESRIKRAEGDAAKFTTILKEYRKAKSITEKRLYLETMEKVLPDIEKIIVPDKDSGNMLNLLNLNPGKGKGGKK